MNLFDSIGLTSDPFSTSPNVDLFYPAVEHRQCLEGLELAIRMRRGLSVIRGGIGVGKTTISRKLIQNFKDESDDFDFYLILDPKFESEIILLKHIIELFGVNNSAESVQECRNIIENHLLKVGVEQGKTLVLIIDEGQNLPGEMLDVFRTLLNFETDEFKLLQLIIFGQPEMGTMIHKYPNFEDRISFDFEIGPISIDDMRGMIDHRIEITGGRIGSWFNERALVKIHKNTQGYPRKVTQLCHQLLLTMISEEKDQINDEMVQRVISGKIDTGGLLQQKKKNYNEIAVNKLLDVLRKDDVGNDVNDPEAIAEDEDDWIGGGDPSDEKTASTNDYDNTDTKTELPEDKPLKQTTLTEPETKIVSATPDSNLIENEVEEASNLEDLVNDFLPTQGKHPPNIKASILSKLPIDKTYVGMHIDSGKISSCVIHEDKEVKTLLAVDIFSDQNRSLNLIDMPDEFNESCQEAMAILDTKMSHYEDRYGTASKSVEKRDTLALTVDNDRMMLKLVDVPKENQKEKKQIIEWSIKKDLQFPIEESILSFESAKGNTFRVGIGETTTLNSICDGLNRLDYGLRSLYPLAQAVHNAFIWSYPENQKKDTIIINIGERNSLILGCLKSELKTIKPLFIGLQSLTDAIRDNGLSIEEWSNRKNYQVPETFLRSLGHKAETGEHDDILRPVFDSWRQELDRTVNGIRKEFKISKNTEVLLCGSAGDIQYLDKYIEGIMGLNTSIFNPFRNLAIPHDLDLEDIGCHPSSLTASIGSALHLDKSVNLLPKDKKIEETLRWVNRFGMVAAAAALVFFIGISISTKLSINSIRSDLEPMQQENNELSYVEERHGLLKENKNSVIQQMQVLSYDIDYFDRILAINKFLSYYTPKEVIINELNFQEGWEIQAYKKIGRDLVKIVRKEDEELRVVRLAGNVNSNSILLDDHFNNFVSTLEESGLFQNIEIMSQASKVGLGNDNLQFELKCVI